MSTDAEISAQFKILKNMLEESLTGEAPSETFCDATNCGNLFTHIIYTDDTRKKISSIKADLGKSGTCPKAHLSSQCELLTGAFRYMNKKDRFATLIMAAGHKCGPGVTCFDVIIRRLLNFE